MIDETFRREVDAYVDKVWEDVVEDIRSLVRIESVEDLSTSGPGHPWGLKSNEALKEALRIAERLGLQTTDLNGYIGFGELPGRSNHTIATIAHSDIVPVGLGWHSNPLDVTRRDGYLLGRGVLDDKGPLVLSLWAAHFFALRVERTGEPLPYTLRCIIGNEEETGMGDVDYYLAHEGEPDFCFTPDADFPLICGEKGILQALFTSAPVAGERILELDGGTVANAIPGVATALVRTNSKELPQAPHITVEPTGEGLARVTATGKGGHASMPEGTANAIGLLVRYLLDTGIFGESERRFLELERTLTEDYTGVSSGIAAHDEVFGPLTCVAGVVRTKDGRFTQTVDCRYPTSTSDDAISQTLTALGENYGCTYQQLADNVPFYISPDSPEIACLLTTYEEYTGIEAKPYVIGGGTYARHFARACAFGPHDPAFPDPDWIGIEHGPDEGVSEEAMRRALKIYIVSIARLMELDFDA